MSFDEIKNLVEPIERRMWVSNIVANARTWVSRVSANAATLTWRQVRERSRISQRRGGNGRSPEGEAESRLWAAVAGRGQKARTARAIGE